MLARIANNLYWMSRYLERAEFLSRYIEIQFTDTADASLSYVKLVGMESILQMNGTLDQYLKIHPKIRIKEVIDFSVFDASNPNAVKSSITLARENAMTVREKLSQETWEAINSFYHETQALSQKKFTVNRYHDVYKFVTGNCYKVKGVIDNTCLRDDSLSFIRAGAYIECAIQVCRIILAKINDWEKLSTAYPGNPYESFNWTCLLKSACSFDMSRRIYKGLPNMENSLEFLLMNEKFPNAIVYCVTRFIRQLQALKADTGRGSYGFTAQKVLNDMKFTTMEVVLIDPKAYFSDLLKQLYLLANGFEENYLTY